MQKRNREEDFKETMIDVKTKDNIWERCLSKILEKIQNMKLKSKEKTKIEVPQE